MHMTAEGLKSSIDKYLQLGKKNNPTDREGI